MTLDPTPARNEIDKLVLQASQEDAARVSALEALQDKLALAQIRPAVAETTTALPTRISVARANGLEDAQVAEWNPDIEPTQMPVGTKLYLFDRATLPSTTEPPPVEPPPVEPPPVEPPPVEPPPSGNFLLGHVAYHGSGSWSDKAKAAEAKFGKFKGPFRVYWGVGSSGVLSPEIKTFLDADRSRTLMPNWKPGSSWANAGTGANVGVIQTAARSWLPYVQNGQLRRIIIWHEPENDGQPLADYIPMWKRVHGIIKAIAPTLQIGFCPISYFPGTSQDTAYYAKNFYAGADYVDFFAPDPYTRKAAPPSRLPENMINQAKVLRALPGAGSKGLIAAEWGGELGGTTADRGTDQQRAAFITAVKDALPQLVANGYFGLTYYDDGSDYLSDSGPDVSAYRALKAAADAL